MTETPTAAPSTSETPTPTETPTESPTETPTSSPSVTHTATLTATSTPTDTPNPAELPPGQHSRIQGIVITENTPLPWAPVKFGVIEATAGPEGEFSIIMPSLQDASVASGLEALEILDFNGEKMEVLPGSAAEIEAFAQARGSELIINALSRVIPGPMCRTFSTENGEELLRFPYTNRYTKQLEVSSSSLNSVWSVSGTPAPASIFDSSDPSLPDDYFGFEWPLAHFTWTDSNNQLQVSGMWKILGKQSQVEGLVSDIPLCSVMGSIADCNEIPQSLSNRIFEQALKTVTNLSRASVKAKKNGKWRPKGAFRTPFFKNSARSLAAIRSILRQLPSKRYICPTEVRAQCTSQSFPKKQLYDEFENILKVKLPSGLKHLVKTYPQERKAFLAELAKHPGTFITCSN